MSRKKAPAKKSDKTKKKKVISKVLTPEVLPATARPSLKNTKDIESVLDNEGPLEDFEEESNVEDFFNPEEEAAIIGAQDLELENDSSSILPVVASKTQKALDPQDPLTRYIREINRYELLSIDQEKALTKALEETGDIELAKRLVLSNLRLVVKIALEYRYAYSNVMDLIQEGNIGLMKAVSKYDQSKGAKLSYYASWWIRSYILKFILDNFRLVKIGTTNEQKKLFYNLLKEKDRLLSMGINPDTKQVAQNLGVSEKAVVTMEKRLSPSGGEVSIDATSQDQDGDTALSWLEKLSSQTPGPSEELAHAQELQILNDNMGHFLQTLKERDREIFKNRLLSEAPLSLQAIADQYGVSRERIRQIEERLIHNLRVYMSKVLR